MRESIALQKGRIQRTLPSSMRWRSRLTLRNNLHVANHAFREVGQHGADHQKRTGVRKVHDLDTILKDRLKCPRDRAGLRWTLQKREHERADAPENAVVGIVDQRWKTWNHQ